MWCDVVLGASSIPPTGEVPHSSAGMRCVHLVLPPLLEYKLFRRDFKMTAMVVCLPVLSSAGDIYPSRGLGTRRWRMRHDSAPFVVLWLNDVAENG